MGLRIQAWLWGRTLTSLSQSKIRLAATSQVLLWSRSQSNRRATLKLNLRLKATLYRWQNIPKHNPRQILRRQGLFTYHFKKETSLLSQSVKHPSLRPVLHLEWICPLSARSQNHQTARVQNQLMTGTGYKVMVNRAGLSWLIQIKLCLEDMGLQKPTGLHSMAEKSRRRRSEEMTHTPVSYVERLSAGLGTWESTSAVTRERSPMDAHSAGGVSVRQVTWKNTRGSTQGRNRTSAISAERASAGERIWKGTRRSTLERIYTYRKCEGSNRNDLLTAKSAHTQRRLCDCVKGDCSCLLS